MLSKNHIKSLKIIIKYYGFTDDEGSLLSQYEIEFLHRRIQSKKRNGNLSL